MLVAVGAAEAVGFDFAVDGCFGDVQVFSGFTGGALAELNGVFDSAFFEFGHGNDFFGVCGRDGVIG